MVEVEPCSSNGDENLPIARVSDLTQEHAAALVDMEIAFSKEHALLNQLRNPSAIKDFAAYQEELDKANDEYKQCFYRLNTIASLIRKRKRGEIEDGEITEDDEEDDVPLACPGAPTKAPRPHQERPDITPCALTFLECPGAPTKPKKTRRITPDDTSDEDEPDVPHHE